MEDTIYKVTCPFCGNHCIVFHLEWEAIVCSECKVDIHKEFCSIEQAVQEDIDRRSDLSFYVEFGNDVFYIDNSIEADSKTNHWAKDNPPDERLKDNPEIPKYPEIAFRYSGWVNWHEFLHGEKSEDEGNGVDLLGLS